MYTFNPIGEFWAVYSDVIHVQVRTIQAWDSSKIPQQASVCSAVAARDQRSSRIHIQLTDDRQGIKVVSYCYDIKQE